MASEFCESSTSRPSRRCRTRRCRVERLIGTIRRECLDRTLFWTAADLEVKLLDFQRYFNGHRTHAGLGGLTPEPRTDEDTARASVSQYRWRPAPLPWAVSDADRGMTDVRRRIGLNPYSAKSRPLNATRMSCP
jgi:Integrase core domain